MLLNGKFPIEKDERGLALSDYFVKNFILLFSERT